MLTLATIPTEAYTPTPEKPWKGIWVGDYGHGHEFLAFLQPVEPIDLPPLAAQRLEFMDLDRRSVSVEDGDSLNSEQNQLIGVKLTGDVNVPRGEYSFIVPDISDGGTIRYADEAVFKGARVVGGVGHIAGEGFHSSMCTANLYIHGRLTFAKVPTSVHNSSFSRQTEWPCIGGTRPHHLHGSCGY